MVRDQRPSLERRRELARLGVDVETSAPAPPRRWLQAALLLLAGAGAVLAGVLARGTAWGGRVVIVGVVIVALGVLVAAWALFEASQRRRWEAAGAEADSPDGDEGGGNRA